MKINSLTRALSVLGIVTLAAGLAFAARSNTAPQQDKAADSVKKGDHRACRQSTQDFDKRDVTPSERL
ncbi:MAG TPA: hypothetical protein VNS63_26895 [Blastocatellia bacterium]|nr:hypothetical protein [Blastocatellia bacterium]